MVVHEPFQFIAARVTISGNLGSIGSTQIIATSSDDQGRGAATGSYLYRLETAAFASTGKMLLAR